jgi:hypothetical protein
VVDEATTFDGEFGEPMLRITGTFASDSQPHPEYGTVQYTCDSPAGCRLEWADILRAAGSERCIGWSDKNYTATVYPAGTEPETSRTFASASSGMYGVVETSLGMQCKLLRHARATGQQCRISEWKEDGTPKVVCLDGDQEFTSSIRAILASQASSSPTPVGPGKLEGETEGTGSAALVQTAGPISDGGNASDDGGCQTTGPWLPGAAGLFLLALGILRRARA